MQRYINTAERLYLLQSCNELSLAIEGRYTNLRIWTSKDAAGKHKFEDHDTVFMRLEKANNYSAPLSGEIHRYLNNQDTPVKQLLKYGFKTSINNLEEILEITKEMKYRDCIAW